MSLSCKIQASAMTMFADKVIAGITANKAHCAEIANKSTSLSTVISTIFGYEIGTKVAHYALDHNLSCKQAALELEILPTEVIEELFDLPNLVNYDRMERLFMKYKNYRKV